jgi:cytochrome P450
MDSLDLNLLSPAFKANPYPAFSLLRENLPLYQIKLNDRPTWIISRFEDVEAVLKDQRFVKSVRKVYTQEEIAQKFPWLLSGQQERTGQAFLVRHMLNADPPDHTRLRSLVNLSFTPRLIEQWRERIQAIANELLDTVQNPPNGEQRHEMELIGEFAFPLPMTVITEMLGVPDTDRTRFRVWSNQVVEASGDLQAFSTLRESLDEFQAYLSELIEHKREQNADDLLGKLIRTEAEGDKLTEDELISMVFLLLVAGHETTVNLIGNGVLALLQHPDQLEKLKQNPELIKSAIEEFLRYRGPLLAATQRWASEDIELGGQQIQRGDQVIVLLSSANRDERAFEHADQLDITRKENHHLAFGKGIHYCLGAPLARLEGQIAISTLLKRMPNLRLAIDEQDLAWRRGLLLMGVSELPVTF